MKHILVIADHADNKQVAFERAVELARLSVADIQVVSFCFEPLSEFQYDQHKRDSHIDLKQVLMQYRAQAWQDYFEQYLTQYLEQHDGKEEKAQSIRDQVNHIVVWEKYIDQWVKNHCEQCHYDMIVKTGHRSEDIFHTPTDWLLFRAAPCPTYCVSTVTYHPKKVVLVALDLRSKTKEKQLLNTRLLEAGFQLAVQTNSVLHCCFAIEFPTLLKDLDIIDVTAKAHQIEKEVRSHSKAMLDIYEIDKSHLHILEGKASKVINSLADKLKAQCIVVGSMGRQGVAAKIIGNTAERIIHHSKADLLVI